MKKLWDVFGIVLIIIAVPIMGVGAVALYRFLYYPLLLWAANTQDGFPAGVLSIFSSMGGCVGIAVLWFYCDDLISKWKPRPKKHVKQPEKETQPSPGKWR